MTRSILRRQKALCALESSPPCCRKLPLAAVLKKLGELCISIPSNLPLEIMWAMPTANSRCSKTLRPWQISKDFEDHGVSISALSCHGNPLHPDKAIAQASIARSAARRFCWPKSWAFR